MTSPIKLETFILRDKFGLNASQLSEEASASAGKRAEVMNWEVIDVRASDRVSYREGEFTCYSFDIWGIDKSGTSESESNRQARESSRSEGLAAHEASQ